MAFIYKITSPSDRIYIGQTINIHRRLIHYKNGHFKKQKRLHASYLKYGWEAHKFEIIEECELINVNDRERFYQDKFNVISKNGLNIRLTNTNDKCGYLSQVSKDKISLANSGVNNGMYGRKSSESQKNKLRAAISGSKNYLYKPLLNIETGIFYDTLEEAANTINIERRALWSKITKNKINKTKFIY